MNECTNAQIYNSILWGPISAKNKTKHQKLYLSETVAWFKITGSSLCDTSDKKSRGKQLNTSVW